MERKEGRISPEEVSPPIKIGSEFMDPVYNHIHHAGYFYLLERERNRIAVSHGIDLAALAENQRIFFPVARIDGVEYKREVREGDVVQIKSDVSSQGVRLVFNQQMEKEGDVAMQAKVTCVVVDENGKPMRIPRWIVEKFESPQLQ